MPVVELEGVPVHEDEAVPDPELVLVAADVAELEGALVDVAVEDREDVEESVADGEPVPVAEIEPEPVREDELVPDCENELVLVLELEAVDVHEEELVLKSEELSVFPGLGEGVPVEELEDVSEVDGERVDAAALDALTLLDDDDVGDAEALCRLAMLRPRYVMEDTTASASPASHSVDS